LIQSHCPVWDHRATKPSSRPPEVSVVPPRVSLSSKYPTRYAFPWASTATPLPVLEALDEAVSTSISFPVASRRATKKRRWVPPWTTFPPKVADPL
jgi:hypothetical protein